MKEMKDDVLDSEEKISEYVSRMLKVSEEELKSVAGGSPVNYYRTYSKLWMKVTGACMNHGYRKATCPKCGALLPKLGHPGEYSEQELKYAEDDLLYCRECHQASICDDWVINKFNS